FPVDEPYSKAQVKAYIGGGGETVYVSTEHIYIVESTRDAISEATVEDFLDVLTGEDLDMLDYRKYGTNIYRIGIQNGNIGGFASAFVPGMVHNQFSMDEYNGYFRITTQTGRWQYASSNVFVLDSDMNICGSLKGLAPEESIYASRFMGDRLYLVTFKQVDPLFVISLKDPQKPVVLGKLKIPGYSEYIHPLDENHIIGFGKDTTGGDGNFAWYQGIKMAIFDVSDVSNPKEKFVEIIGDRGSDSELLRNHKALMFMNELGLMAFPVTLVDRQEGLGDDGHGDITYQGAYVYNVSSSEGFKLRGRITHLNSFDYSDIYDRANSLFINRIIYANESLYTLSGGKVKATRYRDMKDVSEISLD
ncbi:MAG: copper amine oxidase, partial [Clostridiaceae bacterium]|nr:copper amine oxidase [Clostridiaceae bacterium]